MAQLTTTVFSADRLYRYTLYRQWWVNELNELFINREAVRASLAGPDKLQFVSLSPSQTRAWTAKYP